MTDDNHPHLIDRPKRRSIRISNYDYSRSGAYFITVCTYKKMCLFGSIFAGEMRLSESAIIVLDCWQALPHHFAGVRLDAFVIMPNHLHGIIFIHTAEAAGKYETQLNFRQFGKPVSGSLSTIIRSFKSAATKRINEIHGTSGKRARHAVPLPWQRNYYEHIIRDEESLNRIREYIVNNPMQWEFDRENPCATNSRSSRKSDMPEDEAWRV